MSLEINPVNKEITTNEIVRRKIDCTEAGEYDSLHEWSPSFDFSAKADVLENLMKDWETTSEEGRVSIIHFIQKLNKEWIDNGYLLTNILVKYSYLPEIVNLVEKEFLLSGNFSYYLIQSMQVQSSRQENWIQKILEIIEKKGFVDSKKWIKKLDLYREILAKIQNL